MPAIDQIVNIQITQNTTAVSQASFSIPLIVGPTNPGWAATDYVHTYSSPASMLTDGFIATNPEYIYAQALYAQNITPTQFKVGKRATAVAEVDTLKVATLTTGHVYTITVNGIVCSYTATGADTQQSILGALNTLIQAAGPITGAVSGTGTLAVLTLTGTVPGQAVTFSAIDTFLTFANSTLASGIATDLAKILAQDNTWYGLVTPSASDADIQQAAVYVEGNRKLYIAVSATSGIGTSATTDLASALKAAGYKRTALVFSPAAVTQGIDAAWIGPQLAATPGANTWAFKNLAGITADVLTTTQQSVLIGNPVAGVAGKNANIYQSVGGVNITQMGTAASGQFLDITVGLDWLNSTLQTNIYSSLVNASKVPYTDNGTAILMSAVRQAIDQGVQNNLIDGGSAISVTAPAVSTVSTNQRAQRIAPPISFTCRLQGAFHAVTVSGTVTV